MRLPPGTVGQNGAVTPPPPLVGAEQAIHLSLY